MLILILFFAANQDGQLLDRIYHSGAGQAYLGKPRHTQVVYREAKLSYLDSYFRMMSVSPVRPTSFARRSFHLAVLRKRNDTFIGKKDLLGENY